MKNVKTILCLISLLVAGITNVWGETHTHKYGSTNIQGSYDTSTNTLTITGTGAIPNCTDGNNYYSGNNSYITKIIIGEGITGIGRYVFDEYTNVTSITFPSTLTSIATNNFGNSKKIVDIHASSPNQWAQVTITATSGHPFGTIGGVDDAVKSSRGFYFNGSNKKSRALIFTQGLDSIRQYTFYNARYFTSAHIPGSVSRINSSSLTCLFDTVVVNKMDRPILANATTISFNNPSVLIVPTGATNFTEAKYWLHSTAVGKNSSGARSKNEQNVSGTVDGQDWSLSTSGVLTINGSGALSTSFVTSSGASQYPYYYFRYLVDKVVVTGGITALSNILQRCEAMKEIDINQAKVPTASSTLPTLIHGNNILVNIKPASLTDGTVTNLGSAPWNSAKLDIALSEPALFDQNIDNSAWLTAADTYLDIKTFDLQLRSLSNSYNNTFCSPVTLTREQVEEIWGDDTEVAAMTGTSINGNGEIVLTFNDLEKGTPYLEKGTPYLVWPKTDGVTPIVRNVNLSDITTTGETVITDYMTFTGILAPKAITEDEKKNQSIIFLTTQFNGDNQILTWANGGTLNGQRAYWQFKESTPASAMARRPILKFSDETNTATGIDPVTDNPSPVTLKQLRDGQLIIIKNGKTYNAQGAYLR